MLNFFFLRCYSALVRGENFIVETNEGNQLLGFYATKSVFSVSKEEAENKITKMISEDELFLNSEDDGVSPTVYIESIYKDNFWRRNNKGYTFFDMNKLDK